MTDSVTLHALVSGRVQGVGFREWTRRQARRAGLSGSAVNLADGRVEVFALGSRTVCAELLDQLNGADTPGYVTDVQVSWESGTSTSTGSASAGSAEFRTG